MELGLEVMPAPRTTAVGARILDAAGKLFYERGITATGVDLVSDTAGTTKRTLYQRFGSKEGLITAYLRQRAHDWQTHLLAELDRVDPATRQEALAAVFETAASWAADNRRGCAFVNAWAEFGGAEGEIIDVIRQEKAWMRALFTQITGSPEAGEIAHQLYEGAQVCAAIDSTTEAFTRATAAADSLLGRQDVSGSELPFVRFRRAATG